MQACRGLTSGAPTDAQAAPHGVHLDLLPHSSSPCPTVTGSLHREDPAARGQGCFTLLLGPPDGFLSTNLDLRQALKTLTNNRTVPSCSNFDKEANYKA
uniref:Uncharacterized protein n=1 Tax=Sphaerodactylus townsendi TaxID=933632 RepID=A0ACB8FC20_9SAUR